MKLKNWVVKLLLLISFIMILVVGAECDSTLLFINKAILGISIIFINMSLVIKYGRL